MYEPEFFKGDTGQWYWRVKAENGRVVAIGGEGFTERNDAKESFRKVFTQTNYAALMQDIGDEAMKAEHVE